MPLRYLENTAETRTIVEALRRDCAVAVTDVAKTGLIDTIVTELRPRLDEVGQNTLGAFNGGKTLRAAFGLLSAAPVLPTL